MPPSPESITRKSRIDPKLDARGWRRVKAPLASGACRTEEHDTEHGPADYALFLDGRPAAIVETKKTAGAPQNVHPGGAVRARASGEANFSEIPSRFLGQKVLLAADAPRYIMTGSGLREIPPAHTVYLEMAPRPIPSKTVSGLVEDNSHGLSGVRVSLPALAKETTTNRDGDFELTIA